MVTELTLRIKPVRLRQTVYFRVPNDIVDLIGIDPDAEVTLNLEEHEGDFLLKYTVMKPRMKQVLRQSIEPIRR